MSEYQQLQDRRASLQAEQQQVYKALDALRARLPVTEEERRQMLRRYDVGHDDAGVMAETLLAEIEQIESDIARHERRQAEFGDRIHLLNQEIEKVGHRETLHKLLDMRRLEVEAFGQLEQITADFLETWHAFYEARSARSMLARQASATAVNLGLPKVDDGAFPAPTTNDVAAWLNDKHGNNAIEQAVAKFARMRASISQV